MRWENKVWNNTDGEWVTWDEVQPRIGKRLKEMGITEENCDVDAWDNFMDGSAVMVIYRSEQYPPMVMGFDRQDSLREVFHSVQMLKDHVDEQRRNK